MGDPAKRRKKYQTPRKEWDKTLLETEKALVTLYGLKNKKELRTVGTWIKNKRHIARKLLALPIELRRQRESELLGGLKKYGLVSEKATVDDVLGLKVEEALEKRLQTTVFRKGLANTINQARQFVVHGHIAINKNKVDAPGYMVLVDEASSISWYKKPIKTEQDSPKNLKKAFEESAGVQEAKENPEVGTAETEEKTEAEA